MIDINESDSNTVIIIKLVIIILTVVALSLSAFSQGVSILSFRLGKKPRMGFRKD